MELVPKQSYIFVEFVKSVDGLDLNGAFLAGKVVSGIQEKDMIVFFKDFHAFNHQGDLLLVKVDDVLAWVKPESSEEVIA